MVGAVACAIGLVVLRETTMSRHADGDPDSRTRVVLEGSTNHSGVDPSDRVLALFRLCELEVHGDLVDGGVERLGERRFSFTMAPALDRTDRRQLHGCLEDAVVDYLQAEVLEMRES